MISLDVLGVLEIVRLMIRSTLFDLLRRLVGLISSVLAVISLVVSSDLLSVLDSVVLMVQLALRVLSFVLGDQSVVTNLLCFEFLLGQVHYDSWSGVTDGFWFSARYSSSFPYCCLLYTSDAADEEDSVDLGGRRIIKKKKKKKNKRG